MTAIPMPASYDTAWVVLSYVIATVGAFVALTAVEQMQQHRGGARWLNLGAAALALGGIGIWSMHFIGMLALRLNMGVSYAMVETLVSLVAAVAAAAAALHWVSVRRSATRVISAGVLLGLAVVVMHYLGMAGMRFNGLVEWSAATVALSVAIAVGAAIAGLWLAISVRGTPARVGASLVIAVAVCAMHYTGMEAADFVCTSPTPGAFPVGDWLVTSLELPALVTVVSLGIAALIAVDQLLQRLAVAPASGGAQVRASR